MACWRPEPCQRARGNRGGAATRPRRVHWPARQRGAGRGAVGGVRSRCARLGSLAPPIFSASIVCLPRQAASGTRSTLLPGLCGRCGLPTATLATGLWFCFVLDVFALRCRAWRCRQLLRGVGESTGWLKRRRRACDTLASSSCFPHFERQISVFQNQIQYCKRASCARGECREGPGGAVGGRGAARELADQRQQFPAQRRELSKTHFISHERNARFPPAEHAVSSCPDPRIRQSQTMASVTWRLQLLTAGVTMGHGDG